MEDNRSNNTGDGPYLPPSSVYRWVAALTDGGFLVYHTKVLTSSIGLVESTGYIEIFSNVVNCKSLQSKKSAEARHLALLSFFGIRNAKDENGPDQMFLKKLQLEMMSISLHYFETYLREGPTGNDYAIFAQSIEQAYTCLIVAMSAMENDVPNHWPVKF